MLGLKGQEGMLAGGLPSRAFQGGSCVNLGSSHHCCRLIPIDDNGTNVRHEEWCWSYSGYVDKLEFQWMAKEFLFVFTGPSFEGPDLSRAKTAMQGREAAITAVRSFLHDPTYRTLHHNLNMTYPLVVAVGDPLHSPRAYLSALISALLFVNGLASTQALCQPFYIETIIGVPPKQLDLQCDEIGKGLEMVRAKLVLRFSRSRHVFRVHPIAGVMPLQTKHWRFSYEGQVTLLELPLTTKGFIFVGDAPLMYSQSQLQEMLIGVVVSYVKWHNEQHAELTSSYPLVVPLETHSTLFSAILASSEQQSWAHHPRARPPPPSLSTAPLPLQPQPRPVAVPLALLPPPSPPTRGTITQRPPPIEPPSALPCAAERKPSTEPIPPRTAAEFIRDTNARKARAAALAQAARTLAACASALDDGRIGGERTAGVSGAKVGVGGGGKAWRPNEGTALACTGEGGVSGGTGDGEILAGVGIGVWRPPVLDRLSPCGQATTERSSALSQAVKPPAPAPSILKRRRTPNASRRSATAQNVVKGGGSGVGSVGAGAGAGAEDRGGCGGVGKEESKVGPAGMDVGTTTSQLAKSSGSPAQGDDLLSSFFRADSSRGVDDDAVEEVADGERRVRKRGRPAAGVVVPSFGAGEHRQPSITPSLQLGASMRGGAGRASPPPAEPNPEGEMDVQKMQEAQHCCEERLEALQKQLAEREDEKERFDAKIDDLQEELEHSDQMFHDLSVFSNGLKTELNEAKDLLLKLGTTTELSGIIPVHTFCEATDAEVKEALAKGNRSQRGVAKTADMVDEKIRDAGFDPFKREFGEITGVDLDHPVLVEVRKEFGGPVADLILAKKQEAERYCPSGLYPTPKLFEGNRELQLVEVVSRLADALRASREENSRLQKQLHQRGTGGHGSPSGADLVVADTGRGRLRPSTARNITPPSRDPPQDINAIGTVAAAAVEDGDGCARRRRSSRELPLRSDVRSVDAGTDSRAARGGASNGSPACSRDEECKSPTTSTSRVSVGRPALATRSTKVSVLSDDLRQRFTTWLEDVRGVAFKSAISYSACVEILLGVLVADRRKRALTGSGRYPLKALSDVDAVMQGQHAVLDQQLESRNRKYAAAWHHFVEWVRDSDHSLNTPLSATTTADDGDDDIAVEEEQADLHSTREPPSVPEGAVDIGHAEECEKPDASVPAAAARKGNGKKAAIGLSQTLKSHFQAYMHQEAGLITTTADTYCSKVNKAVADILRASLVEGQSFGPVKSVAELAVFFDTKAVQIEAHLKGAHNSLMAGWKHLVGFHSVEAVLEGGKMSGRPVSDEEHESASVVEDGLAASGAGEMMDERTGARAESRKVEKKEENNLKKRKAEEAESVNRMEVEDDDIGIRLEGDDDDIGIFPCGVEQDWRKGHGGEDGRRSAAKSIGDSDTLEDEGEDECDTEDDDEDDTDEEEEKEGMEEEGDEAHNRQQSRQPASPQAPRDGGETEDDGEDLEELSHKVIAASKLRRSVPRLRSSPSPSHNPSCLSDALRDNFMEYLRRRRAVNGQTVKTYYQLVVKIVAAVLSSCEADGFLVEDANAMRRLLERHRSKFEDHVAGVYKVMQVAWKHFCDFLPPADASMVKAQASLLAQLATVATSGDDVQMIIEATDDAHLEVDEPSASMAECVVSDTQEGSSETLGHAAGKILHTGDSLRTDGMQDGNDAISREAGEHIHDDW